MLPDELARIIRGYQASRAVLSAIELDLFTCVGQGATGEEVARKAGADPRATEMLLNALVALGLLSKSDGVYCNSAAAARYLSDASPSSERMAWMHSVNQWRSWSTLTDCVREGTSVLIREGYRRAASFTQPFMAAMQRNARERAPWVVQAVGASGVRRMLDVGGGPACYAIEFARVNADLQAEVLDQPNVVPFAERQIAEAGLADRVHVRAGDLTSDSLGHGWDLILVSNICHILGPRENRSLLRRCHEALAPNGRAVVQDFVLNPDRTSPPEAAMFALNMLVATGEGNSYSEPEYREWLEQAGFGHIRRVSLDGPSDLMVGVRLP